MTSDVRPARPDQSLGELFGELTRELSALVRQEAALARAEMSEKVSHVGKDVAFLAAGGAVAYAGLLAIVAAIIIAIAEAGLSWWAAALIVGVAVAGVGAFLVWKGLSALKQEDFVPRQTLQSLSEERR